MEVGEPITNTDFLPLSCIGALKKHSNDKQIRNDTEHSLQPLVYILVLLSTMPFIRTSSRAHRGKAAPFTAIKALEETLMVASEEHRYSPWWRSNRRTGTARPSPGQIASWSGWSTCRRLHHPYDASMRDQSRQGYNLGVSESIRTSTIEQEHQLVAFVMILSEKSSVLKVIKNVRKDWEKLCVNWMEYASNKCLLAKNAFNLIQLSIIYKKHGNTVWLLPWAQVAYIIFLENCWSSTFSSLSIGEKVSVRTK